MQPHALVLMVPGRAHVGALCVRADRVEQRGASMAFVRGERTVHLLAVEQVRSVEWFADARSAELALARVRSEKAGAATFDVHESVAAVPGRAAAIRQGGAAVAESVSMRIGPERAVGTGTRK